MLKWFLLSLSLVAVQTLASLEQIDQNEFYARSIGRVFAGDWGSCTGTIIGNRLVLTARHCLPNFVFDRNTSSMTFHPMMRWSQIPAGMRVAHVVDVYSLPMRQDLMGLLSDDFAVLVLDVHPSDGNGNLLPQVEIGLASQAFQRNDDLEVVGYGESDPGTANKSSGKILRVNDNSLYNHSAHSEKGMSGGPLFSLQEQKLVGTVVGGVGANGDDYDQALRLLLLLGTRNPLFGDEIFTGSERFALTVRQARDTYGRIKNGTVSREIPPLPPNAQAVMDSFTNGNSSVQSSSSNGGNYGPQYSRRRRGRRW